MFVRENKKELIRDNSRLKRKAQRNPSIVNPLTNASTSIIIKALRTSVKRPRVTRVMGRVRIKRIGFMTALTIPKTRATMRAVTKLSTCTPGSKYAAIKTAIPLINQLRKRLICVYDTSLICANARSRLGQKLFLLNFFVVLLGTS